MAADQKQAKSGKTGLVVEGGGMKCAYSAGILDRFLDDGITFDYCIGVSAGSANTASYLAGQRGRNLRFYTQHIHEEGYFGLDSYLKTGDLFGLHYIYATLTNSDGGDPLGMPEIKRNPAEFEVVATNARTGKAEYFDGKKMPQDDYRLIMASCALPAACQPVQFKNSYYYDGGVADSIPLQRAIDRGCTRSVVILSKPRDFVMEPQSARLFYTWKCREYPEIVKILNHRHLFYREQQKFIFEKEKEGSVFIYAPSRHLPMSTYAMNAEENQALYDLGLSDYDETREALLKFLEGGNSND